VRETERYVCVCTCWTQARSASFVLACSAAVQRTYLRVCCLRACVSTHKCGHLQPIAFGASLNLNLQSQSCWPVFNETW